MIWYDKRRPLPGRSFGCDLPHHPKHIEPMCSGSTEEGLSERLDVPDVERLAVGHRDLLHL